MPTSLIIAAGGTGKRFRKKPGTAGSMSGNKLVFPFLGLPLLLSTLKSFEKIPEINEMIIAVPGSLKKTVSQWIHRNNWKTARVVQGGKTRAHSVYNALKKTRPGNQWVMVHDGARPLVPVGAVRKLLKMRKSPGFEAGILAKKVIPTIKQVKGVNSLRVSRTIDRSFLYEAETPQFLRKRILLKAYKNHKQWAKISDEASLIEESGGNVRLCVHEEYNPKITHARDLKLAEAYVRGKLKTEIKVGLGRDVHRLVTGRKLMLGGVHVPFSKGALGHSDGDVVMHSIADAIWGAIGQGDIGDHFSDRDKRFKNMRSEKILYKALANAKEMGWQPVHIDSVVILETPKLGKMKERIRANLAKKMKLEPDSVSVKAKTSEGLGPEGMSSAVSCEAIVTMKREQS